LRSPCRDDAELARHCLNPGKYPRAIDRSEPSRGHVPPGRPLDIAGLTMPPQECAALGAALESSLLDGVPTLEVRWILPGRLDTAMAGWFGTSVSPMESREDAYLLRPDLGALSVKVRGGGALEVKAFLGSPGILDLPGRARGRMQYWQKWSFPLRSPGQDAREADGWRQVRKQRRSIRFALTGGLIALAGEPADEARCALELTEVRTQHRDWWSCGLEATGPAGSLRTALEATAALVFTRALPSGVELRMADSMSYAEWLRARPGT